MFMTLSKTLGKVGGIRIGIGTRITSKNAWWACLIVFFISMFQLVWYMMVLSFWLMYATFYGFFWCCKKLFQVTVGIIKSCISAISNRSDSKNTLNRVQPQIITEETTSGEALVPKYCSNCGERLKAGASFCVKCGKQI